MTIANIDTLFFTLAFVIPGFLWHSVQSIFVPRGESPKHTLFLTCLAFSCINYALWSWLVYGILTGSWFTEHWGWTGFLWFTIIFTSPVVLGVLVGFVNQKEVVRRCFERMGLTSIHAIPTAWDYKFYNTREPVWVQVELLDGKKICGLFGTSSFASSTPKERDVYIEKAVVIKDGRWQPLERSDGVWINGSQVKCIEFIST
jgi:hypothetical protein